MCHTDWFSEAEVRSDKCEWNGDSKPESKQSHKGAEWHGGAAAFDPQDQIQYKEHSEYNPEDNTSIDNTI